MEKHASVVAGEQVHDIVLLPGTTTHDILKEVNLPTSYCLSLRDGLPFGQNEVVYANIPEGAKLYASPEASVAA